MSEPSVTTNERRHLIGSTDAATILGYGKESRLSLYLRLTGERPDGDGPDEPEPAAFLAGKAAEDAIFQPLIERVLGHGIRRLAPLCHKDEPRMGASFDFIHGNFTIGGEGIWLHECKLTGSTARWAEGDVPAEYFAQVKWQAMVLASHGHRIAGATIWCMSVPGWKLTRHDIANISEGLPALQLAGRAFLHQHIDTMTPPSPAGEDDVRAISVGVLGKVAKLDQVSSTMLERLRAIKAQVKALEAEGQEILDSVLPRVGDATEVADHEGRIVATFRPQREFAEEAFLADHPEIAATVSKLALDKTKLRKHHPTLYEAYLLPPTSAPAKRAFLLKKD